MSSLLRSTWLLYRAELAGGLLSKRMLISALLGSGPILLSFLLVRVDPSASAEGAKLIGYMFELQILVPLLSLVICSGVVAREVEDRTLSYVFTRPIPRAGLLLGRWLAALTLLSALLSLSMGGALLVLSQGFDEGDAQGVVRPLLAVVVLGGIVYSAVFAAIGTFIKHTLIVGLGYVFAFEVLLANLPGNSQGLSVQHHLRCCLFEWGASGNWAETMEGISPSQLGSGALWTLATITLVAICLGCWIVSRRQYELSS